MAPSPSGISPSAIGWALLSQVFWVPLGVIDLHDRWQAHQRDITPPGKALPPSPLARMKPFSMNDLLGAARPVQQLAQQANHAVSGAVSGAVGQAVSGAGVLLSSTGSGVSSLLDSPYAASLDVPSTSATPAHPPVSRVTRSPSSTPSVQPGLNFLGRSFTRSQLLGGTIALSDLHEGPMSPLALAERAIQRGSGDPLAPLPSLWRDSMRQALNKLPGAAPRISTARVVHVPSSSVTETVDVPLALQSDGSVDILQAPSNPNVVKEIDDWSRQQRRPATGSIVPAVVHLHPLSDSAPVGRSTALRDQLAPTTASSAPSPEPAPVALEQSAVAAPEPAPVVEAAAVASEPLAAPVAPATVDAPPPSPAEASVPAAPLAP